MRGNRILLIAAIVSAFVFVASPAFATIHSFEANLDGLQETPPNASPGFGFATMTLDDVSLQFDLTGSFSGLIGTTTDAHVHGPAPAGTPAGVMFGITFTPGVSTGTISFSGVISSTNATRILNELSYINIHSTFAPGGEIRGQILEVPEPSSATLMGFFGTTLLARKRSR